MKAITFLLLLFFLTLPFYGGISHALEAPENYTSQIPAVDFYPSGAKFTFMVEPQSPDGNFTAVLPGSFNVDSVRLANPENVYGDINVSIHSRMKWTPSELEGLRQQSEAQTKTVNDLLATKSALEQTLNLLKNSNPDKSKPDELLTYIKNAQSLRLEVENELSALKARLNEEQEKQRMLLAELQAKSPRGANNYITVSGQAKGTVYIEAFTNSATWRPRYILNLETSSGRIEARMFIRAFQRTGLSYNGKMTLHTKTPDERITTPELQPLKVGIKPKQEVIAAGSAVTLKRNNRMYESARMAMPEADTFMAEDTAENIEAEAPRAPAVTETLADRVLNIEGELPGDGTEREFEVITGSFYLDSKVEITLIPEQRTDAWIVASMDEGNEHLIPGEAELRVDNHSSGKIHLEEYGKGQRRIPFGYAEQITVKKTALIETTGVSWFSGVLTSGYKLEITNGTKSEQVIIVKDRLPVPIDEKIKLDEKRIDPKEKELDKEKRLTWELTVPAGATVPVIVDYTLSYPSGEELQYR